MRSSVPDRERARSVTVGAPERRNPHARRRARGVSCTLDDQARALRAHTTDGRPVADPPRASRPSGGDDRYTAAGAR
ncbi:hypothetical protein Cus16_1874 [Curtobacterium sp. ER1/6]|nr:hypothetical protein Cus16_1874 [Curtobacterium sp. ER1/6]